MSRLLLVVSFAAGFLAAESRTVPPLACLQTASRDRVVAIPVSVSAQGAPKGDVAPATLQCNVTPSPLSRFFARGGS